MLSTDSILFTLMIMEATGLLCIIENVPSHTRTFCNLRNEDANISTVGGVVMSAVLFFLWCFHHLEEFLTQTVKCRSMSNLKNEQIEFWVEIQRETLFTG